MSHQVNFTTHGHDLRAAYEAILRSTNPKTDDNWAMFGYDKGTNDLKVLGQGSGGLEELEDEFMDGKIQYAFARVIDPYSQLNKFVLIAWCGDGVPESKKGLFNSHVADVSLFLKGYHLQINARCEEDVTPAQIMKRMSEGSGSKYSTHQETYQPERIRPLQSAYKKTEIPDIAAMQRNPTKAEPAPKYGIGSSKPFGASTPSTPPVSNTQTRSWNAPAASSSDTTSPPASNPPERSWKTAGGSSYSASTGSSFNKIAPPASLLSYGQSTPNEPSMNKAQQIRMEREAREKEERERIKREIEASEARDRQAQAQSSVQSQAEERRLQEQREQEEQQRIKDRVRQEREAREKEERERAEAEDSARAAREAAKAREEVYTREQAAKEDEQKRQQEQQQRQREQEEKEAAEKRLKQQREEEEAQLRKQQEREEEEKRSRAEEQERHLQQEAAKAAVAQTGAHVAAEPAQAEASQNSVSAVVLYSYEKAEENEMSLMEGEVIMNVTELDVGWWSGESVDGSRGGLFPANYVEVIDNTQDYGVDAAQATEAPREDDHHVVAAPLAPTQASSGKPSAVALYDYTAGEPNEISFVEGDVIAEIEFIADDWWSGETRGGSSGLFPANYVELQA
ncbi:hypothetical protein BG011_002782 [Mortierella polycephala]|uniref:Drebrin-like protein n=1 Tax=Mortierella polycephala TaxID=41804 RepID=A0A9P6U4F1_9FUNG|nr:hypothetical protein BG011_002782 [Mortierella polycephala]